MLKLSSLKTNKLTTTISPKSDDKNTSRILIAVVPVTLLLAVSASMVVPAQATILPRDLAITIPDPTDEEVWWGDCFPPGATPIGISNCLKAAIFDDDVPQPRDPCEAVPEFC